MTPIFTGYEYHEIKGGEHTKYFVNEFRIKFKLNEVDLILCMRYDVSMDNLENNIVPVSSINGLANEIIVNYSFNISIN